MNFNQKMLRLKQCLGVTTDKDVGDLLGLRKTAMSERKARDAFPEEKLRALADARPDLDIDVNFVLTGERSDDELPSETQDEFIGRQRSITYMQQVLDAMNLDIQTTKRLGVLMSGDPQEDALALRRELMDAVRENQVAYAASDLVMVPRYDIRASAGNGALIHSELVVDHLAFRAAWVRERGLNPKRLALIEVRGDSMEPTLRNRDLVLVDLSSNTVGADGIYAIQLNGFLMTKRIQALMDGSIAVISDNPTYRQQTLHAEGLEALQVIGEVVWFGREV